MRKGVLLVVLLVAFSGCTGNILSNDTPTPSKPWNMHIYVDDVDASVGGTLHGSIAPGGAWGDGFYGVEIVVLNEEKEVVERVPVGNLTGSDAQDFNATESTLPVYVSARIDRIEAPQPSAGVIEGKFITESGEVELHRVEGTENYSKAE